jgi:hemerythrin
VTQEVLDLLRNWLLKHITGTDRGYVAIFREAGLE